MVYIIEQHPCESSNIAARGYDVERQVLAVTFKSGAAWHYGGVTPELAMEFMQAPSAGRFFVANIKGKFPAEKMTGPCPRCGDTGIVGMKCDDCGCADYEKEPRAFVEHTNGERTPIGG